MSEILYGKNSYQSWSRAELTRDIEFKTLTARITYDYNQGGLARFYNPVKEILRLSSITEVLELFKKCRNDMHRFDVTVEQAFQLAELFNKYSKYSMEYIDIEGTTVEDAEYERNHLEYLAKKEDEIKNARAWYETLSSEEKKHVDVLSVYVGPVG